MSTILQDEFIMNTKHSSYIKIMGILDWTRYNIVHFIIYIYIIKYILFLYMILHIFTYISFTIER